jgi:hypothetical protein
VTDLQHLVDRAAIIDLHSRYGASIDSLDRAGYEACLTDPFHVEILPHRPRRQLTPSEWTAEVWPGMVGTDANQHAITNHVIEFLDADTATCRAVLTAQHMLLGDEPGHFTAGGHYENLVVRTEAGWRIRLLKLSITWSTGDREVLARAARRSDRR